MAAPLPFQVDSQSGESSLKAPFLFSLGAKMLIATGAALVLSFGLSSLATIAMTRQILRDNLQMKISSESSFLAAASEALVSHGTADDRKVLTALAQQVLQDSDIVAVQVLDHSRHVLAHVSQPSGTVSNLFSLQVPVLNAGQPIGFIRAWYAPFLALEEFWNMTGHLVLLIFAATFVLFSLGVFLANEWILSRPLRGFIRAVTLSQSGQPGLHLLRGRRDEWGVLGRQLGQYLGRMATVQERSAVLFETARLLTTPDGLRSSLNAIFTGILHRYQLSACLILVKGDDDRLHVEASAGVSEEFAESFRGRPGQGVAGLVYASGVPRHIPEAVQEPGDELLQELVRRQQVQTAFFVPLKAEGRVLGTAVYVSKSASALGTDDLESLSLFTDYAALAWRHSRLFKELESDRGALESEVATAVRELTRTNERLVNKVRELKTVYNLALATAASTKVEDIIRVLISGIKELVEVQKGAFFLLENNGSRLVPLAPAFDGISPLVADMSFAPSESSFLEGILKSGQPRILNFVNPEETLPKAWAALQIRSILALPLHQGPDMKGLFCVINKVNGLFSEEDIQVLALLTGRVADILHRLSLDDLLHQKVKDLGLLQEISAHLPQVPVLTDTVSAVGRLTRQALPGVEFCFFYLYHAPTDALVMVGGDWQPELSVEAAALTVGPSEKVLVAEVYRDRETRHLEKGISKNWPVENDVVQALGIQSLMLLPLVVDQGTIGVMMLGSRTPGTFTSEHLRLLGIISSQVAIVIERSRLYEGLRSANDKLEQINRLKNEFITMVSHELRTPLTTIKGFVSIVLNEETGPLNDQQRHFLETSDRAIDRLTLLVSDLLDISRIEAGQIKMQLRPTVLGDVIKRVTTGFAPQFKSQNLTLTLELPEQLPLVLADPDRLSQVLDNLLSNALRFTSKGGITIHCQDKGDYILTSVKDTGSGIPKTELEQIFEKFYQIKVGGGYPTKGTGLGLAIVRSIIESHRGKVWVESEQGKGADFRFILPRSRQGAAAEAGSASPLGGLTK